VGGIFISYRREDSAGHAGRLFDHLSDHLGKDRVFMDVSGIEPGLDFVESIDRAVGSCDVLIAVIGRDWLDCADSTGKRRLDDPNDFIRIETATALKRNIRVIPVLVQGAPIPPQERLPDDLKKLSTRQSVELSDTRWDSDVDRLVETLAKVLSKGESNVTSPHKNIFSDLMKSRIKVFLVAAILLIGGGISAWLLKSHQSLSGSGSTTTIEDTNKRTEPERVEPPQPPKDTTPHQTEPSDEILSLLSQNRQEGLEMLQQGNADALSIIDRTIREAEGAARRFPDDARFHELKGYLQKDVYQNPVASRLLGDEKRRDYLKGAYASARMALRLAPESSSVHNLMGNVFYFQGRCDAAINEYNQALRLNRDENYREVIINDRNIALRAQNSSRCRQQ
jgi:hypothetical protein